MARKANFTFQPPDEFSESRTSILHDDEVANPHTWKINMLLENFFLPIKNATSLFIAKCTASINSSVNSFFLSIMSP